MCDHLHITVIGNDEVGYQGATCEDCRQSLERRVVGPHYEFRTAEEWGRLIAAVFRFSDRAATS